MTLSEMVLSVSPVEVLPMFLWMRVSHWHTCMWQMRKRYGSARWGMCPRLRAMTMLEA